MKNEYFIGTITNRTIDEQLRRPVLLKYHKEKFTYWYKNKWNKFTQCSRVVIHDETRKRSRTILRTNRSPLDHHRHQALVISIKKITDNQILLLKHCHVDGREAL
jgi:hypothetical protein